MSEALPLTSSESRATVIGREDLGFVVSKGLALWMLTLAAKSLPAWAALTDMSPDPDRRFLNREATLEAMETALLFALAVLLWTKAKGFGRAPTLVVESEGPELSEAASPIDLKQLRSSILSAFGLLMFLGGLASLASVLQTRGDVGTDTLVKLINDWEHWRGSAFEAILGALVFARYTFGGRLRRFFQYRRN